MIPEFTCGQVQRTVLAVEKMCVLVEALLAYGIHRFRVLDHGLPVLPQLQLLHPLDIPVSGVFI